MKSNQKYKPLKTPSYLLYLAFMAAFALAALYFRQYLLAAAEGGITLILAIVALVMKRKKAKQLTAYIESITYDTENAKNSTLLSFPLPMAVFRLSDSSVVWANDAFRRRPGGRPTGFSDPGFFRDVADGRENRISEPGGDQRT